MADALVAAVRMTGGRASLGAVAFDPVEPVIAALYLVATAVVLSTAGRRRNAIDP